MNLLHNIPPHLQPIPVYYSEKELSSQAVAQETEKKQVQTLTHFNNFNISSCWDNSI